MNDGSLLFLQHMISKFEDVDPTAQKYGSRAAIVFSGAGKTRIAVGIARARIRGGATGAWAGWDLNVAPWTDGAWLRLPPRTGWGAWGRTRGCCWSTRTPWIGTTPTELQNTALLGIGTTADTANPFSAKLNAALWTAKTVAEGGSGDLFYTMNEEAAGRDLGLTHVGDDRYDMGLDAVDLGDRGLLWSSR